VLAAALQRTGRIPEAKAATVEFLEYEADFAFSRTLRRDPGWLTGPLLAPGKQTWVQAVLDGTGIRDIYSLRLR
jgi:hypothetical protein